MKNIRKITWQITFIIITSIAVLLLSACGKDSSEDINIDIDALAESIVTGGKFKDSLSPISSDMAKSLYGITDDKITCCAYFGTGATAEQVAVFETDSSTSAGDLKAKLSDFLTSQAKEYANYLPDEVSKLESAYLEVKGKYVVLCVCEKPSEIGAIISGAASK